MLFVAICDKFNTYIIDPLTHPVVGVVLVFDEDVLVVTLLVVVSIVGEVEDVDPGNCVDEGFIVVLVLVIVLVLVDVVGGGQVQR